MDETQFLAEMYRQVADQHDLEIIGLNFERTKNEEKAKANIQRLIDRYEIGYEMLIPGDKSTVKEKLPMLNHIMSYPTTIVIDKQGNVHKIHTGFAGPATGSDYYDWVREFKAMLIELAAA